MKVGTKTTVTLVTILALGVIAIGMTLRLHLLKQVKHHHETIKAAAVPWPKLLTHVRLNPCRQTIHAGDVGADNAFYYIRQIKWDGPGFPTAEWRNFESRGITTNDYPGLKTRYEQNTRNMFLFHHAASMATCQVETCESFDARLPYLAQCLNLSRALCFHAESGAREGKWSEALKDWQTVLAASAHVSRGGVLIHQLICYADTGICCRSIRRTASTLGLPPDVSRQLISVLADTDLKAEPLAEAMRYERLAALDMVRRFYADGPKAFTSLCDSNETSGANEWLAKCWPAIAFGSRFMGSSPSTTSNHIDALYSHIIDIAASQHGASQHEREIDAFLNDKSEGARLDDPLGRIVAGLVVPAANAARIRFLGSLTEFRATRVILAVRLFQDAHDGKLPQELGALVPDYLPEIPKDPHLTSSNLIYRVSGDTWTVYSVGPDQSDNGGSYDYAVERSKQPDICFPSDEYARKVQDAGKREDAK